jgi:hypothetical protein
VAVDALADHSYYFQQVFNMGNGAPRPAKVVKPHSPGVPGTPYSRVTAEDDCLVVGIDALLPPVCIVTGDVVHPAESPPLHFRFQVSKPTMMERKVLGHIEEYRSFRYYVRPEIRQKRLNSEKGLRLFFVLYALSGVFLPALQSFRLDKIIVVTIILAWLAVPLVGWLVTRHRRREPGAMRVARLSVNQVWIAGLPQDIREKLVNYSPC